jgi:hypothetical protein
MVYASQPDRHIGVSLVKLLWTATNSEFLKREAIEVALRALAKDAGAGLELTEDDVVLLNESGIAGGYPLAVAYGPDGSRVIMANYQAICDRLDTISSADLRAAGIDQSEEPFVASAMQLLRRRYPHWPIQRFCELESSLPDLYNMALDYADNES